MENTEKVLDLNKTVYDLTQEYPEVKDFMEEFLPAYGSTLDELK